jgi:mRNA interferase MazF
MFALTSLELSANRERKEMRTIRMSKDRLHHRRVGMQERWAPVPYADRLAEKRPPALVISNRKLAIHGVIWVAMITSAENEPWPSDIPVVDLARAGLPVRSVVRPAKIACIDPVRIGRRLGRLDKAASAGGRKAAWVLGGGPLNTGVRRCHGRRACANVRFKIAEKSDRRRPRDQHYDRGAVRRRRLERCTLGYPRDVRFAPDSRHIAASR